MDYYSNMNGGRKRKWLKENRQHILWIANNVGDAEACRVFNMKPSTLERLALDELQSEYKWTKSDRAVLIAKVAESGVEELKDAVAELNPSKDYFDNVVKPVAKVIHDWYDKVTAGDVQRQALLKIPVDDKGNCQLTHRASSIYVMSRENSLEKQYYAPLLICKRTGFPCPSSPYPDDDNTQRQLCAIGVKSVRKHNDKYKTR